MDDNWYWCRDRWDDLPLMMIRPLWYDAGEWPPDWVVEPPKTEIIIIEEEREKG